MDAFLDILCGHILPLATTIIKFESNDSEQAEYQKVQIFEACEEEGIKVENNLVAKCFKSHRDIPYNASNRKTKELVLLLVCKSFLCHADWLIFEPGFSKLWFDLLRFMVR